LRLEELEPRTGPTLVTWTGAGANANWSTAANWDLNQVPGFLDDLTFPRGASQTTNNADIGTEFKVINFQGPGYHVTGRVEIAGINVAALNLNNNDVQIDSLSALVETSVNLGSGTLTFGATSDETISAVISGTGALVKQGTGRYTLTANSTYTGPTTVANGFLDVSQGSLSPYTRVNLASVSSKIYFGNQSIASLAGVAGSDLFLGGNLTVGDATNSTYAGSFSGGGGIVFTKAGTGTLTFPSPESGDTSGLQGELNVNAGTIAWTGLMKCVPAKVAAGATLAAAGTLIGSLQTESGGTFAPGGSSPGTLIVNNDVAMHGIFAVQLYGTTPGSGYDQLRMEAVPSYGGGMGALDLTGSTLNLSLGSTPAVGQSFTIINRDAGSPAVMGTFSQGATITSGGATFAINYAGPNNSVVLTCIAVAPAMQSPPVPPSGPVVNGEQVLRSGRAGVVTSVRLQFDSALNPATAGDVSNYVLRVSRGKGHRRHVRSVVPSQAIYNAADHMVTLFVQLSAKDQGAVLTVKGSPGGVTGVAGNLLDGNMDGTAGGDAVFTLNVQPRAHKH
jgi:autotransporter-associated beta strand protein